MIFQFILDFKMWLMVLNGLFLERMILMQMQIDSSFGKNGQGYIVGWCIGEAFNIIPFPSKRRSIKNNGKDVAFFWSLFQNIA